MKQLTEVLHTPVNDSYDVAVCGGGVAGIAAALAAARLGRKTLLIEREYLLGGLGTAGLVTIYLPICDGMGHKVSGGIAEELLLLSIRDGAEALYPENWIREDGVRNQHMPRYEAQFNPHLFAIHAERLLRDAGADILYGTQVTGVRMEGSRIDCIITENKSGRKAYRIQSVVDATGDCDLAAFAGISTVCFSQGNVLASWYYSVGQQGYQLNTLGFCDVPEGERTEENAPKLLVSQRFKGIEAEELSAMMELSHSCIYRDFREKRDRDRNYWPVTIAAIPQVRMTRRLAGEYTLSEKEEGKFFADSVGMIPNWKKRGPVYEIPLRTLCSAGACNLLAAGRCISVTDTMWDISRAIPCCAVTGQAAGTAAAMTDDIHSLPVEKLQTILRENGVILHRPSASEPALL